MGNKETKQIAISFLTIAFLLFCVGKAYPSAPGSTSANFLKIGPDARPVAMGGAFCAVGNDINSINWNPAGLGQMTISEGMFTYVNWLEDIKYGHLAYGQPSREFGTVALGLSYVHSGDIEAWDIENKPVDSFKAYSLLGTLSWARVMITRTYMGFNLKYIEEKIEKQFAKTCAFDFGMLHKTIFGLNIGVAIQNIGRGLKFVSEEFPLPLNIKLGVSFNIKEFTFAVDLNKPIDDKINLCGGLEISPLDMLSLRLGYKYFTRNDKLGSFRNFPENLFAGLGFKLGNLRMDYAFVPYGNLGETHRFSLHTKFGQAETERITTEEHITAKDRIEESELEKRQKRLTQMKEREEQGVRKKLVGTPGAQGKETKMPEQTVTKEKQKTALSEEKTRTYVVKKGDTLSGIAKKFYGNALRWKKIYEANKSKIKKPHLITPGLVLLIPEE